MEVEFQWHWPKTRLKGQHINMKVGSIFNSGYYILLSNIQILKVLSIERSETGRILNMISVYHLLYLQDGKYIHEHICFHML